MKLVKFDDGKFGIRRRRWFFIKEFKVVSLHSSDWRTKDHFKFWECRATQKDAEAIYSMLTDNGKEVKYW